MRLAPARVPLPNRSRHAFRARNLLAGVCGLGLLAAAGCGSSAGAGSAVSTTVTIAAVPGVDDAALYLARKNGLFAAEGLDHVQIKGYTTQSQVINALQTGQADIAASDWGNAFFTEARQSRNPNKPYLRILADGYDATAGVLEVLTLPKSKTSTSPQGLANTTVGVPNDDYISLPKVSGAPVSSAPVSLDAAAASSVLSDYLGSNSQSVNWEPMSQSAEITQLKQHKLEAILVSQPYIYQAESEDGAVEVLDACSGSTSGLPLLGYVANNAWVRDNPAAVADFQAALAKAQAEAAMTGAVQGILPDAAHVTTREADMITIGTYPTSTSIGSLQAVVRLMYNSGMITNAPNVGPMLVKPAR